MRAFGKLSRPVTWYFCRPRLLDDLIGYNDDIPSRQIWSRVLGSDSVLGRLSRQRRSLLRLRHVEAPTRKVNFQRT